MQIFTVPLDIHIGKKKKKKKSIYNDLSLELTSVSHVNRLLHEFYTYWTFQEFHL